MCRLSPVASQLKFHITFSVLIADWNSLLWTWNSGLVWIYPSLWIILIRKFGWGFGPSLVILCGDGATNIDRGSSSFRIESCIVKLLITMLFPILEQRLWSAGNLPWMAGFASILMGQFKGRAWMLVVGESLGMLLGDRYVATQKRLVFLIPLWLNFGVCMLVFLLQKKQGCWLLKCRWIPRQ